MSTPDVVNSLVNVVDLGVKLHGATDQLNNVRMVFENRSTHHVGTFATVDDPSRPQDWELLTPYLGSTSLNKHTGIYEPSTAISVSDVVDKQGLTLNLYTIDDTGHVLGGGTPVAIVDVNLTSEAGVLGGKINVKVRTVDADKQEKELLNHTSTTSFTVVKWAWGQGPLVFGVGWAHNKYVLQVTIANLNKLF